MTWLTRIFTISSAVLFLIGCAERKTPQYIDIQNTLTVVSQTQTNGWAADVWVHGNHAFIADGEQGLTIWDVSDLAHPHLTDTIQTTSDVEIIKYGPVNDMLLLYKDAPAGGITAYNATTKHRLFSMGSGAITGFDIIEQAQDTVIILMLDDTDGWRISHQYYNSARSLWMEDISGIYWPERGSIRDVRLDGNYIYAAHNQIGLDILEFTEIDLGSYGLNVVGSVNTPGACSAVTLNAAKTHAVVADYQAGVQVIDITNKTNPRIVGEVRPTGVDRAYKACAAGDTVYVVDQYDGIFAVDVSVPASPRLIARYVTPRPVGIFVRPDHTIFVADENAGLIILGWR
ncbi:MAG: hypothetical protein V2A61_06910 [Calditrichota bacterium]